MNTKWEDELEQMRNLNSKKLNETVESCSSEKSAMRSDFEVQLERARQELNAAHERWDKREGRPEDMERIHHLETVQQDLYAREKKAREEMMYFKRELMNREENFNHKFIGGTNRDGPNGVLTTKNNIQDNRQAFPTQPKGSKQRRRRHTAFPQLSNG